MRTSKMKKYLISAVASIGAYNASYTFGDMADITGDVIGTGLIEAKDFTSLFVLLGVIALVGGLIVWARSR